MGILQTRKQNRSFSAGRRALFSILPAGAAGCLGCARQWLETTFTGGADPPQLGGKANVTWEEMFRFAYQKDLIPVLRELGTQLGREELAGMLRRAADEVVRKKTTGPPPAVHDLMSFASNMKNMPPLMQHALEVEIVEQSPEAFEYRV